MSESLHLVAVHVELFSKDFQADYERFTDRVLSEIADNKAMWSIGNEAIEGKPKDRETKVTRNLNSGPDDLPRTVTLKEEMARFTFRIMGEHEYWLDFGGFDLIHRETSNEDVFSADVERFIKYAKDHPDPDDPLGDYRTFITVYEFHANAHYSYEGEKDIDYEWYFVGFLDDLSKLRTIVRQSTGDPCAKCEGTGYKRETQTDLIFKMLKERQECEICKGSGAIP